MIYIYRLLFWVICINKPWRKAIFCKRSSFVILRNLSGQLFSTVKDKDKDKEEGLDLCATLLARPMNPMPHHIASIGHWDPPKDPVYDLRRIHSTQQPVMSLQFKN